MSYSETLDTFQKNLGYSFKNRDLLVTAFTHTTYVFEHKRKHYESNQRLEFIGDGVLDFVVGRVIYDMNPEENEGYLSKTRSLVVCEKSLAQVARKLNMGECLLLGRGEETTGGREKESTLADAFESVLAAVYYDGGFYEVERVILKNLSEKINDAVAGKIFLDYKSRLLELAQEKNNPHVVSFEIVDERGPAHLREFDAVVYADGTLLSKATGHSKKDAEQNAAKLAIDEYLRLFENGNEATKA